MELVGRIRELVTYPVKSMAGVSAASALLGWHGLEGDRRFAFRRSGEGGGNPWLSASRMPELLRYQPVCPDENSGTAAPTHVRTPTGKQLALRGADLQSEVTDCVGEAVELMNLRHGVFDEASVSVIAVATIAGIAREAGRELDPRRFRANILLETESNEIFVEDAWIGGTLIFGDSESSPAVSVTRRDLRCVMINLDPDTAEPDARIMKTVVRLSENNAGVYASAVSTGRIRVGDPVNFVAPR